MPRETSAQHTLSTTTAFIRNVVPDWLDLRAHLYQPPIAITPGAALEPKHQQDDCNGCTGFALASIKAGCMKRYHQLYLSDGAGQKDTSCKPILGYSRSLPYLVSQSCGQGKTTQILGMENISTGTAQCVRLGRAGEGISKRRTWML